MSGTQPRPALASYRDTVTELFRAGEAFDEIEIAIDEVADLSRDEKASLWLFAFSLRDKFEQRRVTQAHPGVLHLDDPPERNGAADRFPPSPPRRRLA